MPINLRSLSIALVLAGIISGPALAATDSSDVLLRGAKKWVEKDRADLAKNMLQKLILIEPNSTEALYMLGNIEMKNGKPEEAQRYLQRLEQTSPNSPRTRELRDSYRLATTDKAALENMRSLAQAGKTEQADKILKQVFPEKPPKGELGVEYYRISGSTKAGYNKTQDELSALYKETGDTRYRLLQLELQSYRSEHLTTALRGYEELSRHGDVNTRLLQEGWRRSLYKYPDNTDKQGAIKQYLTAYPNDKEMIALLGDVQKNMAGRSMTAKTIVVAQAPQPKAAPPAKAAAVKPAPAKVKTPKKHGHAHGADKPAETAPATVAAKTEAAPAMTEAEEQDIEARTNALDALQDGKLDEAETSLSDLLKRRPQDPEILGGLGFVHLRRGQPGEAEKWFTQAAEASKGDNPKWVSLVSTAGFWKNLLAADKLLDENKLPEAEATIQQALALQPDNPDGLALLGNIKSAGNDLVEAERLYREVLGKESYNVAAIRGLSSLLTRSGRGEEALALIEKTLQNNQSEISKNPSVQAGLLREEADLYLAAHRTSHAIQALEMAVLLDPKNPWVRFSLAKLYISLDLTPLGMRVLQEGVTLAPKDPVMHYVRALVLLSLDDYTGALDSLAQIPEPELTRAMLETRNRALMQYYFQQAEYKFAHGDRKEAIRIMSVAQIQAQENYSATEQVAEGWFQLGLQKQGLSAMRKLPQPVPLKTQIYFASLLNRASQDQELANYLPTLHIPDSADETSKKYRATIQDIEFAMAGRQFDKLMKAGKTEQAQQFADTILNANQLSNAEYFKIHRRYFSRAELPGNAISLLNQEKEQNPNEPSVRWDLANAYHEDKQDSNAQRELDELLSLTRGDDVDMRLRIASLQQNVGDSAGSRQTLNDLMERYPDNTDVLFQAGNIARADGKYNQAMRYYQQISEQAGKPAPAAEPVAVKVAEKPAPNNILLDLLPAKSVQEESGRSRTSLAPALQSTAESEKIYRTAIASDVSKAKYVPNTTAALAEQQMASIASNRSAKIEAGLDIQSKTATSGTSTYNAIEIPVLARFPIGYEAHGTLQVDKVNVDAGALPNTFNDAALFGKVQAFTAPPLQPVAQSASGTSIGLGYEQDSVRADLGVIGIGFPVSNVVGGIVHGGNMGRLSYSLNLSRRPYTGSLISYAGARDTVSGTVWGGVTNTGLSLYLSTTLSSAAMGSFNVSTMASYGLLRGQNVLNNDRLYLRLAVDQDIYSSDDMVLNLGLNANFMRFSKNESFYTFGHGGYYSPQNSLSFGLPLELIGRSDLLSYQLKASVSYSRTKEDAAAFYPNDPALQSRAAVSFLPAGYAQAAYPGGSGGGFGYGLRAATEYRLTPNFAMGGRFNIERSAYYAPNSLLIYGRYMFNPETGPVKMRPEPVIPYSQY